MKATNLTEYDLRCRFFAPRGRARHFRRFPSLSVARPVARYLRFRWIQDAGTASITPSLSTATSGVIASASHAIAKNLDRGGASDCVAN